MQQTWGQAPPGAGAGDAAPPEAAEAVAPVPARPPLAADPLAAARTALADRDYLRAITLLDGHLARRDTPADETAFLRANALLLAGEHQAAITAFETLIAAHPQSPWHDKARFRLADAHVAKTPPDFAAAAAIVEPQVAGLLSPQRRAQLAEVYLAFADAAFAPTERDKTGRAQPPQWNQAQRFYTLALEVGLDEPTRERVEYALAVCEARQNNRAAAIRRLQRFVKTYAPRPSATDKAPPEAGPAITPAALAAAAFGGERLPEARYLLGEVYALNGQPAEARSAWRDMANEPLRADRKIWHVGSEPLAVGDLKALALYRVAWTYNLNGGDRLETAAHVKALADFTAAFPHHALVAQARYQMALASLRAGQTQQAVDQLKAFLTDRAAALPASDEAADRFRPLDELVAVARGDDPPPQARGQYLTPLARYHLGNALLDQGNFAEAIDVWQTFLARHPGDGLWTTVQRAIVDAEFAAAQVLADNKKPDEARTAWERFILRHPLDRRVPGLYYTFGQMRFTAGALTEALADWRLLVGKFPNTEEAGQAQYRIALTLETKLDAPAAAVEEYRRLSWSSWAPRARQRLEQLTNRELTIRTESVFRSDQTPVVKLFVRNIPSLTVRVYDLDAVAYYRKQQTVLGVEFLDLSLIEPTRRFTHKVAAYADLKPIEDVIPIPMEGAGARVVTVGDDLSQATTLIIRSDLDILVKAGRDQMLVFAQNMRTGQPMPGAEVFVGDGREIVSAGVTGPDGVLRWSDRRLREAPGSLAVMAIANGHVAGNAIGLRGLTPGRGLTPAGYIHTDRGLYQPGQTVAFRAVVRDVQAASYAFTPKETWQAELLDPAGRLLQRLAVEVSEFGTLAGRVTLAESAPTGRYRLQVRREATPDGRVTARTFSTALRVERYKLPSVTLAIELPETTYLRGEVARGRIVARHVYGEPLVNRPVVYNLGDGRQRAATTDAAGHVPFEIDTRDYGETTTLPLTATLPDENISAAETLRIATRGFGLAVSTLRDVYLVGENFEATVTATDPRGKPLATALTATLVQLKTKPGTNRVTETLIATRPVACDALTGRGQATFAATSGGGHLVRFEGTDRFGQLISVEQAVTISSDDDRTRLRVVADQQTLRVGQTHDIRIHSRLPKSLALVTYEADGILGYELTELRPGYNTLRVTVEDRHFPNFAVGVAVMETGRLHSTRYDFAVERQLKITLRPSTVTTTPGATITLAVSVTDQNDRPVSAEVAIAVTDAALTALADSPTGAISAAFRGQTRQLDLRLSSSCTFNYAPATVPVNPATGGPSVTVTELAALERQLRGAVVEQARELRSRADIQRFKNFAQANLQQDNLRNWTEARQSNKLAELPESWYVSEVPTRPDVDGDKALVEELAEQTDTSTLALYFATDQAELEKPQARSGERMPQRSKQLQEALQSQLMNADGRDELAAAKRPSLDPLASERDSRRRQTAQTAQTRESADGSDREQFAASRASNKPNAEVRAIAEGKDGGGGGGLVGALRKAGPANNAGLGGGRADRFEFVETAYWNPTVVSDAAGLATLEITLPGNITRWLIQAQGVTASTSVGHARVEITARKEFFVELRAPMALRAGDSPRLAARVHNLAPLPAGVAARQVTVTLTAVTNTQRTQQRQTLTLTAGQVADVVFGPQPVEAGALSLEVSATAEGLSDTVRQTLPVRPRGVRFVSSDGATARNSLTAQLELPAGRAYRDQTLSVTVGPTVYRMVVDMALGSDPRAMAEAPAKQVADHSWRIAPDGTSSTAGDLLAAAIVADHLAGTPDGGGLDRLTLNGRIEQLAASLVAAQNPDGGWSWRGAGQSSETPVTARVAWALATARIATSQAGPLLDPDTLRRAVISLDKAFATAPESDLTTKAMVLHALCEAQAALGELDGSVTADRFAQANRLHRLRQGLSTAALAHLTLTLVRLDRKPMAAETAAILNARQRVIPGPVGQGPRGLWKADTDPPYLAADVETTALAVMALQAVNPRDPAIEPAITYLGTQRRGLRCLPDKATGLVVAALGRFHSLTRPAALRYRLTLLLNGRPLGRADVTGTDPTSLRSLEFVAPAEAIVAGVNKIEILVDGQAEFTWSAILAGYAEAENLDLSGQRLDLRRTYQAAPAEYDGRPLPRGFSVLRGQPTRWVNTVSQLPVGRRIDVTLDLDRDTRLANTPDYFTVTEPLPAGCAVLADSVTGGFDHVEFGEGQLTFSIGRRATLSSIRYTLVGLLTGAYTAGPPVLASVYQPHIMRIGATAPLAVLARDEVSSDPYRPSPDELYELGRRLFAEGRRADARQPLTTLYETYTKPAANAALRDDIHRDTARMLLGCALAASDNQATVRFFEILKERYPDLIIPNAEALQIGRAYLATGEAERGLLVLRATADAIFVSQAQAADVMANAGRFEASVAFLRDLLRRHPDSATSRTALFSLAQLVATAAANPARHADLAQRKATSAELLSRSIRLVEEFLSLYPDHVAADQAAFAIAANFLELEDYRAAATAADRLMARYPDSPLLDKALYLRAYCAYARDDFDQALADATRVARERFRNVGGRLAPSDDRHLATYILGQIHHSRRQPQEALVHYRAVADRFPDAHEAVAEFTRQVLDFPEVRTFPPLVPANQPGVLPLPAVVPDPDTIPHVRVRYRNLSEVELKVYRVDLAKLYLTHKNLSAVTAVNLAGITPALERVVPLAAADGPQAFADRHDRIGLPELADRPGAYLVVARGGNIYRSGLILVTGLAVEVAEDTPTGRVRVSVRAGPGGEYLRKITVRAIGEGDDQPVTGKTDLRGLFIADDLHGRVTVLAADDTGQYAFYRGTQSLQGWGEVIATAAQQQLAKKAGSAPPKDAYVGNLRAANRAIQVENSAQLEKGIFGNDEEGIRVKAAK